MTLCYLPKSAFNILTIVEQTKGGDKNLVGGEFSCPLTQRAVPGGALHS